MYINVICRSNDGNRRYAGNFSMDAEGRSRLCERTGLTQKQLEDAIDGLQALGADRAAIPDKPYEAYIALKSGRVPKALEGGVV